MVGWAQAKSQLSHLQTYHWQPRKVRNSSHWENHCSQTRPIGSHLFQHLKGSSTVSVPYNPAPNHFLSVSLWWSWWRDVHISWPRDIMISHPSTKPHSKLYQHSQWSRRPKRLHRTWRTTLMYTNSASLFSSYHCEEILPFLWIEKYVLLLPLTSCLVVDNLYSSKLLPCTHHITNK